MARDMKNGSYMSNRQDSEQTTAVAKQHRANKAHSVKTKWDYKCKGVRLALLGLLYWVEAPSSKDPNPFPTSHLGKDDHHLLPSSPSVLAWAFLIASDSSSFSKFWGSPTINQDQAGLCQLPSPQKLTANHWNAHSKSQSHLLHTQEQVLPQL